MVRSIHTCSDGDNPVDIWLGSVCPLKMFCVIWVPKTKSCQTTLPLPLPSTETSGKTRCCNTAMPAGEDHFYTPPRPPPPPIHSHLTPSHSPTQIQTSSLPQAAIGRVNSGVVRARPCLLWRCGVATMLVGAQKVCRDTKVCVLVPIGDQSCVDVCTATAKVNSCLCVCEEYPSLEPCVSLFWVKWEGLCCCVFGVYTHIRTLFFTSCYTSKF